MDDGKYANEVRHFPFQINPLLSRKKIKFKPFFMFETFFQVLRRIRSDEGLESMFQTLRVW